MTSSQDPRDRIFDVSGLQHGLGARTGRSATTILAFAVLKIVIALGSTAVLARYVPPEQQGLIAMALPIVLIATGLSEFGLAHAIVQRATVTHQLVTTLFWTSFGLGTLLCLGVAFLGKPAVWFYGEPKVQIVFIGLAPYVLLSVLTSQYVAILRRQMRIFQIELGTVCATAAGSGLAILAAVNGAGYWALAIQLVLAELFNYIYLLIISRWLPSGPHRVNFTQARSALTFGGYLAAERLLVEVTRSMQTIVIGRAFSQLEVGLFYRTQSIALLPQRRISSPLAGAFIPALSRLQDDDEGFNVMYRRQVVRGNLIMIPIGLVFVSCPDIVVRILLGDQWLGVIPILTWLSLMPMSALVMNSFSWAMVSCGKSRQLFQFRIFSSMLLLTALLIGAQFGLMQLIAGYVLTMVLIQAPLLATLMVRNTPVRLVTLRRTLLNEILMTTATVAGLIWLRTVLDLSPVVLEGVVVGVVLMLLYGLRILVDSDLRGDFLKAVRSFQARRGG